MIAQESQTFVMFPAYKVSVARGAGIVNARKIV